MAQRVWDGLPQLIDQRSPGRGSRGQLKQFAEIVYRFLLQKRSNFRNFAQITSWLLISTFNSVEMAK